MKLKAKHRNLIEFLCVLLGAVFAFSVGLTFALPSLKIDAGSTPHSTTTYMGNQEYVVINDSLTAPINFGVGSNLSNVSLQYSICYNFDVRFRYSLEWSGGASTDNVILTFPNRDNFIVDNSYIFVRDTITAGAGMLNIISAVSFVDTADETYSGQKLTIKIDEVKIYRAQSTYNNTHLFLTQGTGISTSEAATGWFNYKSRADMSGQAYAMVYNYRYDEAHGVIDPGDVTAYYKDVRESTVQSARRLYGNRYYAGMGVYLVTGSSPVKVKALAVGSWQLDNNRASSDALVFETNIRYNYAKDWISMGYQSDNIFENVYYDYIIPAHSTAYLNIVDSVEITCIARTGDYSQYKMITNLTINDVPFTTFNNGIATGTISSANVGATKTYSTSTFTISNETDYNPYLYDTRVGGSINVPCNISITNNTGETKGFELTNRLKLTISNGNSTLNRTAVSGFADPNYYYRAESISTNLLYPAQFSYIAPYSTKTISMSEYYVINAALQTEIQSNYGGIYDAWLSIDVGITDASAQSISFGHIISTYTDNTLTVYAKNETDTVMQGISINLIEDSLQSIETNYTQYTVGVQPPDWTSNYWNYYILQSGNYVRNTSNIFNASTIYYQKSTYLGNLNITNETLFNDFSTEDGRFFSSNELSLMPGEITKVFSVTISSGKKPYVYGIVAAPNMEETYLFPEAVNECTDNGYIMNYSNKSYYIFLPGTYENNPPDFISVEGNTLYLGVIRPGQIIKVPFKQDLYHVGSLEAKDTLEETDFTGIPDAVVQALKDFLGDK